MHAISIVITRFVNEHQPGFVECTLLDALSQPHFFVEKVPVVTTEDLWSNSSYPRLGIIACEVESEWNDETGRTLVRVNTERPWGVESIAGATQFVVLSSQIVRK